MSIGPRSLVAHVRGILQAKPLYPIGHFYSPVPSAADGRRAAEWLELEPAGIDLRRDAQAALVGELGPRWSELDRDGRWAPSDQLSLSDAAVYASVLRHRRPARVLEVGSGYTTAVALDTIQHHALPTELVCIEPFADRLRGLLREGDVVELHEVPVQDADTSLFARLAAGDVLFIDSTHVAKAGSDLVWLLLHVLPRLAPGVLVHFHDIFWPMEYPREWLEQNRGWNEIYFLHAFLMGNPSWQIELFNDYVWSQMPEVVDRWLPEARDERPGSLWVSPCAR